MTSGDLSQLVTALLGGIGGTILLLTPGYVMGRAFSRGVRSAELTGPAFVAGTAIGGVVVHALFLFWTVQIFAGVQTQLAVGHPPTDWQPYAWLLAWVLIVMLLSPAVLGAAWAHVTDRRETWIEAPLAWFGLSTAKRTAEAWIWAFHEVERKSAGAHVTARLRDGTQITGTLGADALASSDARVRDLYLEETWTHEADGTWKPTGKPIWIAGDQIVTLEFEIVQ